MLIVRANDGPDMPIKRIFKFSTQTSSLTTGSRPTSNLTTQFSLLSNLTTQVLPLIPSPRVDLYTYMAEFVMMLFHNFSPKPTNALVSGLSSFIPRHQNHRLNMR
jgi:hypothetical protein